MTIQECFKKIKDIAKVSDNIINEEELLKYYPKDSSDYKDLYSLLCENDIVIISVDDEIEMDKDLECSNDLKYDNNQPYDGDLTKLYLNEIGTIRRLKPEEEIELSKIVILGNESQNKLDNLDLNKISKEEYDNLLNNVENGIIAKNKLVEANLRLVMAISKKFKNRGLPLSDINQAGSMGLMRACDKYDYRKGYKFSTYATWWIRQGILDCILEQTRTIRIPSHVNTDINKFNKTFDELTNELGRMPKIDEIASKMNITSLDVVKLINLTKTPESLDKQIDINSDTTLSDVIASDSKTPFDNVIKKRLSLTIDNCINEILTPKEGYVLKLKYGLLDGIFYSNEKIALELGVTRQRIDQIVDKALKKLYHSNYKEELKECLRLINNG